MKYTTFFLCACSILLLGSCKNQPAQNGQPLEVMTFNIRLDAPSDSANNWKYRKDNACKMIAYYQPDLLGMQVRGDLTFCPLCQASVISLLLY